MWDTHGKPPLSHKQICPLPKHFLLRGARLLAIDSTKSQKRLTWETQCVGEMMGGNPAPTHTHTQHQGLFGFIEDRWQPTSKSPRSMHSQGNRKEDQENKKESCSVWPWKNLCIQCSKKSRLHTSVQWCTFLCGAPNVITLTIFNKSNILEKKGVNCMFWPGFANCREKHQVLFSALPSYGFPLFCPPTLF